MAEIETIRETVTIQPDGTIIIPYSVRKITEIQGVQGFCRIKSIGKNKVVLTILARTDSLSETAMFSARGRVIIPFNLRRLTEIQDIQGFCQVENVGKDDIALTILNRWKPTPGKSPERGVKTQP